MKSVINLADYFFLIDWSVEAVLSVFPHRAIERVINFH